MRNNTLVAMMVGLLFVATMLALWFTYQGNSISRHLQDVNNRLNAALGMRNLVNATYNEAANYSKTHPDIIPILQQMTNSAAKPAASGAKTPAK